MRAKDRAQNRMKTALPSLVLWLVLSVSSAWPAKKPLPAGKRVIEPFDFRGVRLQPGPLRAQVDEVRAFYLAIPDDDLLKGFRARAGLPAPGKDLGGWYTPVNISSGPPSTRAIAA